MSVTVHLSQVLGQISPDPANPHVIRLGGSPYGTSLPLAGAATSSTLQCPLTNAWPAHSGSMLCLQPQSVWLATLCHCGPTRVTFAFVELPVPEARNCDGMV